MNDNVNVTISKDEANVKSCFEKKAVILKEWFCPTFMYYCKKDD